jgi:proteasome lid subunit RPN8/RPN11
MTDELTAVRFERSVLFDIAAHAAAAYPREACGALVGAGGSVRLGLPLANHDSRAPEIGFRVDPRDYLRVETSAEELGLALLGFWHSHPDGLALPSASDRANAWPGLLTVIVAVVGGAPDEISAWRLDGENAPFRELPIDDGLALVTTLGAAEARC